MKSLGLCFALSAVCALSSACTCQIPDTPNQPLSDGVICKYVFAFPTRQLVVNFDGRVKFIDPENLEHPEMTAKADIVRRTANTLTMKIVMVGRTDVFSLDLKTLKGYQELRIDGGTSMKYPLACSR